MYYKNKTVFSRKTNNQSVRSAGGRAVSPRQDRVCRGRRSQECYETSGFRKSHRKKGTLRGRRGFFSCVLKWNWVFNSPSRLLITPFQTPLSRPKLVSTSRVKNSTSCGIPWSSGLRSCRRTTLTAAALLKSCPCCRRLSLVLGPASFPHRTSTARSPSLQHSQVTATPVRGYWLWVWMFKYSHHLTSHFHLTKHFEV